MIVIRDITPEDGDSVISLHRRSIFGLCKGHYTENEMKAWTDRLTPGLFAEGIRDANNAGVVAVAPDGIVGYGFINIRESELRALYVLPGFTGCGVGGLILARLEEMAREHGINRLLLQSTLNAVGYYERSGYRAVNPEIHRISDAVSIACVRMEKTLE